MDINYFDIIVGAIILLLGLKGIINGFFKEVFGLLGIVGGVFVASRLGDSVGEYLSSLIFHFENHSAISFTGFLVSLILFWALMITLGMLLKKLGKLSGLGIYDKILGFVVGSGKFFFIVAIIIFAVSNVKSLKPTVDTVMQNSIFYPVFVSAGGFIMKIDPVEEVVHLQKKADAVQEKIQSSIENNATQMIQQKVDEIKETIESNSTQK